MEAELIPGAVVVSLKGHDTGRVYCVAAGCGEQFVLLLDGKYRKLNNPKQKRVKHLRRIGQIALETLDTDAALRRQLKPFMPHGDA